jgi:hypothetical protein
VKENLMTKGNPIVMAAVAAAFATTGLHALADGTQSSTKQQAAADGQGTSGASASAQSGNGAQGTAGNKGTQRAAANQKPAAAIVLVPIAIATTETFGDGCWVRLYDDQNFTGNELSLIGPMDMANMRTAFGRDWSGEFDSVAVGPKATVMVYDNENYGQRVAKFQPNQRIRDLDEKMGFFEDIRSLKIACAGGGATAQKDKQQGAASGAPAAGGSPQQSGTSGKTGSDSR